jgi:Lipase (class 3)
MLMEAVGGVGLNPEKPKGEVTEPILQHLKSSVTAGTYDSDAAELLAFGSTWTYSDLETFSSAMLSRGLIGCDCAYLEVRNDALLVNSAAYLVQSSDRKLVVVCFRGTEPENVISWVNNLAGKMVPFSAAGGRVHGGFQRSFVALWPTLKSVLEGVAQGRSLFRVIEGRVARSGAWALSGGASRAPTTSPTVDERERGALAARETTGERERGGHALPDFTLYLTGHSLGGALAVLAAAEMSSNVDFESNGLRRSLRGVYTYGQPMVGNATFCERFQRLFTPFRHVYGHDIVPHLPAWTMGEFAHFGEEYSSSDRGWAYTTGSVRQTFSVVLANVVGVADFVSQMVVRSGPYLSLSWADHLPAHYLRTSRLQGPPAERAWSVDE